MSGLKTKFLEKPEAKLIHTLLDVQLVDELDRWATRNRYRTRSAALIAILKNALNVEPK